jgi:hypothetical protein
MVRNAEVARPRSREQKEVAQAEAEARTSLIAERISRR